MAISVYVFKIVLAECPYTCERTIAVSENSTLYDLAGAVIAAMGWGMSHLWEFDIDDTSYGLPDGSYDMADMLDSRAYKIKNIFHRGDQCRLIYDYGDSWEHYIRLQEIREKVGKETFPALVSGVGVCPPDDCGGVDGLEDLIRILKDPDDPEYEDMAEWADDFDPTEPFAGTQKGFKNLYNLFKELYSK